MMLLITEIALTGWCVTATGFTIYDFWYSRWRMRNWKP